MSVQARRYTCGTLNVTTTYWGRSFRDHMGTGWMHTIDVTITWPGDAHTTHVLVPSQNLNDGGSDVQHRAAFQTLMEKYVGCPERLSIVEREIVSQIEKAPPERDGSGRLMLQPRQPKEPTA